MRVKERERERERERESERVRECEKDMSKANVTQDLEILVNDRLVSTKTFLKTISGLSEISVGPYFHPAPDRWYPAAMHSQFPEFARSGHHSQSPAIATSDGIVMKVLQVIRTPTIGNFWNSSCMTAPDSR